MMNQEIILPLDLSTKLKLDDDDDKKVREIYEFTHEESEIDEDDEDEEEEEDDDEGFSFSVAFDGVNQSQITAEDVFFNGQIKPVYPFFDQDLLLEAGVNMDDLIANNQFPNVKKVFIETGNEEIDGSPATASTSGNDNNNIAGPYCEWEKKVVEVKKSNSTGFSKLWRFKEFMHRSSSDGRDAYVFFNNTTSSSSSGEEKAAAGWWKAEKKIKVPESQVNGEERKVKAAGDNKQKVKGKKVVSNKSNKKAPSSHEVYMKSKAKDGDRRRTYLPYRPEVVGFFTNVTGGGLTRNVHPF